MNLLFQRHHESLLRNSFSNTIQAIRRCKANQSGKGMKNGLILLVDDYLIILPYLIKLLSEVPVI